jgi:DNA-binding transcriptional regulator YiaG
MSYTASIIDELVACQKRITPLEIRDIRLRLGMSCRELATAVGLKGRRALITVYRWERGKVPSVANIEALRRLGASIDEGGSAEGQL